MTTGSVEESINKLAAVISTTAVNKGFWTFPGIVGPVGERLIKSTKMMLVVTELAELTEAIRATEVPPSGISGFTNEEEELADAIIRLLDYSGYYRLNIGGAILAKMEKNLGRPYLHGKSF